MYLREVSDSRQALAGLVDLHLITDMSNDLASSTIANLWKQVYLFEKTFSRFIPMSELSIFNRQAGLKTYVTPEFKELLKKARELGIMTNGLYNPFILPALQRAGYRQSAAVGYENDIQEDYSNKKVVSVERIEIGDNWARIPYGTAIDLGGCGKGYLADNLGRYLESLPVAGYWLSLSGDIRTMGYDENNLPIYLNIQDAASPSLDSDWIIKCEKHTTGIATSGTFRRKNQDDGKQWHHLIDPRTKKPAQTDVRLATVIADNAVLADVLASCAVILGSDKAPKFLKQQPIKSFLLQCTDNSGNYFDKKFGKSISKNPVLKFNEALQNA